MIRLFAMLTLLHSSGLLAAPDLPDAGRLESLRAEIERIRIRNDVAGVGLVLVSGENVLFAGGLGVEDWDSRKPMTESSLIRIGSITKTFTGLAALRLKQAGRLDLNQTVPETRDELRLYRNNHDNEQVTIAQLLEHTAGLRDLSRREFDYPDPLPLEQALRVEPRSRTLGWAPGYHSEYTNSGAGVAAWAIEQATGIDFDAYTREQVLLPLGMDNADLRHRPGLEDELATGYNTDGRTTIAYWHTLYRPFGGIHARVSEMAGLIQLYLNRGRIQGEDFLSTENMRLSEQPQTSAAARAGLEFGYGYGNYAWLRDGILFQGHGGDADGYLSRFGYSHELGTGYFIVINAFQNSTLLQMRRQVERYLINGTKPRSAPPAWTMDDPERYTGIYRRATWRFGRRPDERVEITLDRRGLRMRSLNERRYWILIPVAPGLFRRPDEPLATAALVEENGTMYLQTEFGNYERESSTQP